MNFRISNNLFESIRNVTNPQVEEPAKVEEAEVDKAHFCATHVEHAMLGLGTCISEQHAEPDEQGQIAWYTVEFPTGTHRIQTSNLRIVEGKSHSHSKKMAEAEENIEEKKLHPNQQVLDVHEPEKDELTADDFKKLRAGKTQKTVKEEQIDELSVNTLNRVHRAAVSDANDASRDGDEARADKRYNLAGKASNKAELKNRAAGLKPSGQHSMGEGHAGTVTMKQVDKSDATPQVKAAIKKSAPDIKSYADRAAALTAAGIKREAVEQIDEIGDTPAGMEKVKAYRAAVGRQYHKTGEYDTRLSDADRKPNPFHAKDAANMPNAANKRYSRQTGAARAKKIETGTQYEETNNPFDVKNYKSQIPTKPGETAGFDSKKISTGTVYTKKFTKEKPEPAGKAFKPKAVKEGISQTIINYDDFRIDVTDNPTYGDYLRALQTMVESRDESIQQEVVAIATAAYDEKIDSIIIESKARQLFAGKLDEIRKSGSTVLDESYIVESNSTYVEYTVEKDGVRTQYVHIGTNGNK